MNKKARLVMWGSILSLCLGLLVSCAKQKKKEDMTFDELRSKAFASLEKKHNDDAAEYLEQIISQYQDRQDISKYKLLLAGIYFKSGKYQSSCELYENFNQFYPSDTRAEYSKYRAVLAKFYQTLRSDCDQTPTEETTKLCQEYMQNPEYKKYRTDVSDIQNTCEHKLIDKEIYVYDFYLNRGEYAAAKNRLKYLKENYLTKKSSLEPRLLYLESKLAKKEKDIAHAKNILDKLNKQFPESQYTTMTHALIEKPSFLF